MATPRADSITAPSGAVVAGGRRTMPAWRNGLAPLTWAEVPTSNLLSAIDPRSSAAHNPNYPSQAPWCLDRYGSNTNVPNNNATLVAYGAGCTDLTTGDYWLPSCGGHSDYAGNEVYKLTLSADSPTWVMVRPPSGSVPLIVGGIPAGSTVQGNSYLLDDGKESTGVYADGRPRSTHGYRKHLDVPGLGIVMTMQAGTFITGGESSKATWLLDKSTGEWTYKSSPSPLPSSASGGAATLDQVRNCAYFMLPGGSGLWKLDLTTWAWTWPVYYIGNTQSEGYVYAKYVPELDLIVLLTEGYSTGIKCVNPTTWAVTSPTTTTPTTSLAANMGIDWVPALGCFVLHPISNSGAIYTLTPPASGAATGQWTWGALTTSGTPAGVGSTGWWNKFGYSAKLKGLFRIHAASAKPWFLPLE